MTFNQNNVHYLLIDGTPCLYRAYYSSLFLKNNSNVPSGAIYGFINTLKKLSFQYPKTKIILIFDSPTKTFRHTLFNSYKLNRPKMPQNLRVQVEPLYKIIKMIGFPVITVPYYEADDIIGTLACEAEKNKKFTLISTNDKDFAQLVSINIKILETKSNKILGIEEMKKRYGINPTLIPDLFGLMGDRSDNIPGIPGIGKKTATFLLKTFGSLKNIYINTNEITNHPLRGAKNIVKKLIKNKNLAFISKNLATIRTDVSMQKSLNELKMFEPSIHELLNIFKHYKFYNFVKLLKQGKLVKYNTIS
ncbi:hypothetical protein XW81_01950 [Buchnera aphidicola (Schlechtendalia chinensis)]|uniref:5'-3' exonuclease domain-containing protein n=1 Tax=Buchnera aphidicola subsp. Schlechtendalia chinensis TaxID=118110 RepID=A0A172WDU6_BUCSC|nr:5'-3' exonuclease H3TH domain-containing protein [Buchnera aphidicola]ANF17148.1 hypothetical protein XW81_01950 [Buchnera aphidicola (Schlechtendalia chinensis)]